MISFHTEHKIENHSFKIFHEGKRNAVIWVYFVEGEEPKKSVLKPGWVGLLQPSAVWPNCSMDRR
jgi:hypothetical protein